MLVKIRLTKTGKKNSPSFRLVAVKSKTKRDGLAIEYLGYYDPKPTPSVIELETDRIKYWLSQGAQPSDTVKYMLIKKGIMEADKVKKVYKKLPGKKKQARAAKDGEAAPKAEIKKEAEAPAKKKDDKKD